MGDIMKFENDRIRKPFKIKGAETDKAQYQIQEFPHSDDWLRLIDLRTGEKATNETFFYLMGREIEIVEDKPKNEKCIYCKKEIVEGLWCCTACKELFYLEHYGGSGLAHNLEDWIKRKKICSKEETMRRFDSWKSNNPGKSYVDYLHSLGEFKKDGIRCISIYHRDKDLAKIQMQEFFRCEMERINDRKNIK